MMVIIHILQLKFINLPKVIELVDGHIEMQIQVCLSLKHKLLTTMPTVPKTEIL